MTTTPEEKLMAAVHEYTHESACISIGDGDERVCTTSESDGARAKLLDAVHEYAGAVGDCGTMLITPDALELLRAKAAVCDAYLAFEERFGIEEIQPRLDAIYAAKGALRKLQDTVNV